MTMEMNYAKSHVYKTVLLLTQVNDSVADKYDETNNFYKKK